MENKIETFIKPYLKNDLPDIRPGDTIKIYQKIKETAEKKKGSDKKEKKERIQVFQGLVLVRKHGKEIGATITVRKVVDGIGVEKTFPVHSPNIEKIEVLRRGKVRRAKLYYLRDAKGKKSRLKSKPLPSSAEVSPSEAMADKTADEKVKQEEKENAAEEQSEVKNEENTEENKNPEETQVVEKTEKEEKDEKTEEK